MNFEFYDTADARDIFEVGSFCSLIFPTCRDSCHYPIPIDNVPVIFNNSSYCVQVSKKMEYYKIFNKFKMIYKNETNEK